MSLYYWIFSGFWQTPFKFSWEKGVKKLDSLTKEKGDYNVSATTWGPSSLMRSLTTKNCMGSNWNFARVQKHSWEWKCPQDIFFTYQNVSESQTEYFGNVAVVTTWTFNQQLPGKPKWSNHQSSPFAIIIFYSSYIMVLDGSINFLHII